MAVLNRTESLAGDYASGWSPFPGRKPWGYFRGPDGKAYDYGAIAYWIRQFHSELIGKHIFVQLEALGLREAFDRGTTPCGLPFSFTPARVR